MAVERVDSLDDPRVADYRDVRDADLRGRDGLFMVEGRLGVRRLLTGGRFRTRSILLSPSARAALDDVLPRTAAGTPVYVADLALLRRVVGFDLHRGCLAAAERGRALDFEVLRPPRGVVAPRCLVLEDLANPDNVGGAFRNAMAFGAHAVLLSPRCADPLYRKAVRVSMGGALEVPTVRAVAWPDDLRRLRALGWTLVALDPRGDSCTLDELAGRPETLGPLALLVGTEGRGVSPEASGIADWRVRIEMAPGVDSLNVATATGIALHALWSRPAPGGAR